MEKQNQYIALTLGFITTVILSYISVVLFQPIKWNVQFPGGRLIFVLALVLSFIASIGAAKLGQRWWYVISVWAIFIFIYLTFFYRPPMWV